MSDNLPDCGNCLSKILGSSYSVGWLDAAGEWRGKMTVCGRCYPAVLARQNAEMGLERLRQRMSLFGQRPVIQLPIPNA